MYRYFVIALLSLSFWPAKVVGQETQKEPPPQAEEPASPDNQSSQPDQQKTQSPAPQPEQTPAEKESAQPPAEKENTQAPAAKNETQPASKADKTKSSGKHSAQQTPSQAPAEPHKVVVHKGSIGEPKAQLAPGMTEEQANHNRQNAKQLLASTENNLQTLSGRTLNASQQDTVGQIRNYMGLARTALGKNDPQRARNLAFKAHLLSDDLVKH
jgi:hypothetical protein